MDTAGLLRSDGAGGKERACQCRDLRDAGSIPGSGRSSGGVQGNTLQYSCLGQRNLAGYSPWGYKELNMTEVT